VTRERERGGERLCDSVIETSDLRVENLRGRVRGRRAKEALGVTDGENVSLRNRLSEDIACGVAGGRQEDAGAAGSPELQGTSEVQGRGRQS
jgi:hypothetical protein